MVATIALDAARNNPDQDPAVRSGMQLSFELQQKAHEGKSNGGKGSGANDQRPQVTANALQAAPDNPDSTAADIAEKENNHSKALALQQKASKGKSDGGKNAGKYRHYERNLSLLYSQ